MDIFAKILLRGLCPPATRAPNGAGGEGRVDAGEGFRGKVHSRSYKVMDPFEPLGCTFALYKACGKPAWPPGSVLEPNAWFWGFGAVF